MIAERTRFSFSAVARSGSVCRLVPARDLNAAFFQEEARAKWRCHFPLASYSREPSLRFAPENPLTEISLTISITCSTINQPTSLRSDRLVGFNKVSDRFQTRMLIAFAGIRIVAELS
jgi:hypothetical protein